ncbi:hypothetical protein [Streptomyces misionensis]|uniref:hypothetical protein n=1 Tax=Streptomyces misionensis TaxID=67331 RepID=UPI00142D5160|nr:hypothetical protein [Streptomyces misionensis]
MASIAFTAVVTVSADCCMVVSATATAAASGAAPLSPRRAPPKSTATRPIAMNAFTIALSASAMVEELLRLTLPIALNAFSTAVSASSACWSIPDAAVVRTFPFFASELCRSWTRAFTSCIDFPWEIELNTFDNAVPMSVTRGSVTP